MESLSLWNIIGKLPAGIKFLALQFTLLDFIHRVKKFFKNRKNVTYYLFLDYKFT